MDVEVDRQSDARFIAEARGLVNDLFTPRPLVYWLDLLACIALGYTTFALVHLSTLNPVARVVFFVLCGLAFYRGAMFIHELVHLNRHEMRGFRIAWNTLIGIPFLVPSFLYYTHLEHHRPRRYGTHHDGEYLPLGRGPSRQIFFFLLSGLAVPVLAILRFAVLTPLSWVSRWARTQIHRYASAMVIDPSYARPVPNDRDWRTWRMQEIICFVYLWCLTALVASGAMSWTWVFQAYLIAVFVLAINAMRTLAAHRYRHLPDKPHTMMEQLADSINHPDRPLLTEVWAPVGLRFHALHHLFPGLPYHALPEAHRRLMAGLESSSPYHGVNSSSLLSSLRQLWRDAARGDT